MCSFSLLLVSFQLTVGSKQNRKPLSSVMCLLWALESIKLFRSSSSWNRQLCWLLSATVHATIFYKTLVKDQQVVPSNLSLWSGGHPGITAPQGVPLNIFHKPLKQQTSRLSQTERCIFRVPIPLWWYSDLPLLQIVLGLMYKHSNLKAAFFLDADWLSAAANVIKCLQ